MFFYLSKTLQFFADPGNVFLMALIAGAVLGVTRLRLLGRILTVTAMAGALLLTFVPIGAWMYGALEARFPPPASLPDAVDGIVVLGGVVDPILSAETGRPAINGAVERIIESAALAGRYPSARIVYTGGSGRLLDQEQKEADYVSDLYIRLGVPAARLTLERDSRNTIENAKFVYGLVKPTPDQHWLLVTSAFHMPRSIGVFRQIGWEVTPYPVDFNIGSKSEIRPPMSFSSGLSTFNGALHEWLGLAGYWLAGNIDSAFPRPRRAGGA
jgi:uncharacterized SAM-binding protein YcdF (DUF218 family)